MLEGLIYKNLLFCILGQRVREVETVRKEHPSKVPVIIERYRHENQLPPLDRSKFLIPEHLSVGELIKILRYELSIKVWFCFVSWSVIMVLTINYLNK